MNNISSSGADAARVGTTSTVTEVRDDRILPEVRLTAVVVIFVLLVTVVVLYGLPDRTGQLFQHPDVGGVPGGGVRRRGVVFYSGFASFALAYYRPYLYPNDDLRLADAGGDAAAP
ncbi:MAG: hypothetical protein ABIQ44_10600 [Chloroflexia bacterium]